jgi:hypothetical protein
MSVHAVRIITMPAVETTLEEPAPPVFLCLCHVGRLMTSLPSNVVPVAPRGPLIAR